MEELELTLLSRKGMFNMKAIPNTQDKELARREIEEGYITYKTLAERVGHTILGNSLYEYLLITGWEDMELISGSLTYEDGEEYPVEIFMYFVITGSSAKYLKRNSNEIVFYHEPSHTYFWGITHYGTSWDYVFTDIKVKER